LVPKVRCRPHTPSKFTSDNHRALLTAELAQIFTDAPLAPNFLANARTREAYAKATGAASSSTSEEETKGKKRLPSPEDDCPICYETLHGINESTMTFCEVCGNAIHNECFQQCMQGYPSFLK
jgi:hypothetical protein